VAAVVSVALSSPRLQAQQGGADPELDSLGFKENRSYLSLLPFEHIDTATGGVILTFDTLVLAGNAGFNLAFRHTYNSKEGWTSGIAGIPLRVSPARPFIDLNPAPPPGTPLPWVLPRFTGMADGSDPQTLWKDGVGATDTLITRGFWLYEPAAGRLKLPNGLTATFIRTSEDERADGVLSEVSDAFGNTVRFTQIDGGWSITQELSSTESRSVTWTGATLTSEGRTWAFDGATLQPPTGPAWGFSYGATPDSLTVTTPNGGTVRYEFATRDFERLFDDGFVSTVPSKVLTKRAIGGRNIQPAEWLFAWPDDYHMSVEGPAGEVLEFTNTWRFTQRVSTGYLVKRGNSVLETETLTYDPITFWNGPRARYDLYHLPVVKSRNIVRNGRTYSTTYDYHDELWGDYAHPWKVTEIGEQSRTTTIEYKHGTQTYRPALIDTLRTSVNGGPEFVRSYDYDDVTGFKESEIIYGISTTFEPDTRGNVKKVIDGSQRWTEYTYQWGAVKTIKTPKYGVTVSRTINPTGTIHDETRRGAMTTFDYDLLDRRTKLTPHIGYPFETDYALDGTTITERRSDGAETNPTKSETVSTLDGFGRVVATQNTVGVKTSRQYDPYGRVRFESLPFTGSSGSGTTTEYDDLGRVKKRIESDGHFVSFDYFDGVDVTITEENAPKATRITTQDWSAFGDPATARLVGLTDADAQTWSYEYNAIGRLLKVTQPDTPATSRTWTYVGNNSDRLASEVHPESGTTSYTEYDGAGRVTKKTTPNGQFEYSYDENGRLQKIDPLDASDDTHDVTMGYDESDNRTLLQNGFVRSEFGFDLVNRLKSRKDTFVSHSATPVVETKYGYDGWDNMDVVRYASGNVVSYDYDTENRVIRAMRGEGSEAPVLAEVQSYHPSGGIETLRIGLVTTTVPAKYDKYHYDARHRVDKLWGDYLNVDYTFYPVGNVKTLDDSRSNLDQGFDYDNLDRLTSVTGFGANGFGYDALGNRKSTTAFGATYVYNTKKQLEQITGDSANPDFGTYSYDPGGNLKTFTRLGALRTYTYTPFNMLETASVESIDSTYRYDGDQLRKIRYRTRTAYAYDQPLSTLADEYFIHGPGNQLLGEYQALGTGNLTWRRDYVYLGQRLVASLTAVANTGATVSIVPPSGPITEGGSVQLTVQLTTSAPLTTDMSVPLSYAGGTVNPVDLTSDLIFIGESAVYFAAGSVSGASRTILITAADDTLWEALENVVVRLGTPSAGALGATSEATVSIADNDPPPSISVAGTSTVSEAFNSAIQVSVSTVAGQPVYVEFTAQDLETQASDFSPGVGTVTIPAGSLSANVAIHANADGVIEHDEKFQVTITSPQGLPIGQATSQVTIVDQRNGDFNVDGTPDLLWQHQGTNQWALWWIYNSAGTLSRCDPAQGQCPVLPGWPASTAWKIVASADFSGDGYMDLLWRYDANGDTWLWLMNGVTQTGDQPIGVGGGDPWRVVGVSDFTGDGKPDIVWQNDDTGQVAIWQMSGGTFVSVTQVGSPAGAAWKVVGTGRFDADAKTDLLLQNHTTGDLKIWHLNGVTFLGEDAASEPPIDPNYWVVGTGDFNHDGVTDLVWKHQTQLNCVAIWLMDASRWSDGMYGKKLSGQCIADAPADFQWKIVSPR
jgi:YD repeat-containing protein